jgi:hypothetical protein
MILVEEFPMQASRRTFLQSMTGAAALGMTSLSAFRSLYALGAEEPTTVPARIEFTPDIEPFVRLIEETPRKSACR